MAGNSREITYIQFDSSSNSPLTSPTIFALRVALLTFFVVSITIVTMSSLSTKDTTMMMMSSKGNGSNGQKLPQNLQVDIKYDQLPILSMTSAIEIEASFNYNSSKAYDAFISLSDIDDRMPSCTWKVRNLMTDKSLGFLSTQEKVHIGNGTTWNSKFQWLRASVLTNGTKVN